MDIFMLIINGIYACFAGIALFHIVMAMRYAGKSSWGVLLGDFAIGMSVLIVIRFFFFLVDASLIHLDDTTVMVMWHILFFDATAVFFIATRSVVGLLEVKAPKPKVAENIALAVISGLIIVAFFIFAKQL